MRHFFACVFGYFGVAVLLVALLFFALADTVEG